MRFTRAVSTLVCPGACSPRGHARVIALGLSRVYSSLLVDRRHLDSTGCSPATQPRPPYAAAEACVSWSKNGSINDTSRPRSRPRLCTPSVAILLGRTSDDVNHKTKATYSENGNQNREERKSNQSPDCLACITDCRVCNTGQIASWPYHSVSAKFFTRTRVVNTATKTAMIANSLPRDRTVNSVNQLTTAAGTVNASAVGEM